MEIESIHLQAKLVQRSKQQSAVASAAYRSGSALTDARTGKAFDYTRRLAIEHTRILSPSYAPEWVSDRNTLWNTVEAVEKRKDAQVAREIEISIPAALPSAVREQLIWTFCENNFVALGMIADVCLHGPGHGDPRNYHAHVMLSTREIGPDGFGKKNRDWNANEHLETWKTNWERHCNAALEAAGIDIRVDRRSIEDRRKEKLAAARTATDWIARRQLEIEAERLNYIPRPHLPQKAYRAMVKGEVHPGYETEIEAWKQARISKDAAAARADEMQQILDAEIDALSQLGPELDGQEPGMLDTTEGTDNASEPMDATDLRLPDEDNETAEDLDRQTRDDFTPEAREVPDCLEEDPESFSTPQGGSSAEEAVSASETAQEALEVDKAIADACAARGEAERRLARAQQNLSNARDILEGKRDHLTGEILPKMPRRTFELPSPSEPDLYEPTDDDIEQSVYEAYAHDGDGDDRAPSILPLRTDYDESPQEQRMFERHLADWEAGETVRLNRAATNKRSIWESELPKQRQRLRKYGQMDLSQIVGKTLEAVRSIFGWMRDRVTAARGTLGSKHELTKEMQADWVDVLIENRQLHELVRQDEERDARRVNDEAGSVAKEGRRLWDEVEQKRGTGEAMSQKSQGSVTPHGPE
ncbi:MobQ family relaxase [Roseicitreum antarcticum]|uniref:MobA/MobL family protein n=1 Tax=Roseicitreum antarcticum TaxID=564137 RepID=A0A1H3F1M8_9RHOB|nr:MobQ family relaxase [Roseicitreum antarcticum]SDX84094.1 MobA/MobL family protein [Roseicitreum antarcticum]